MKKFLLGINNTFNELHSEKRYVLLLLYAAFILCCCLLIAFAVIKFLTFFVLNVELITTVIIVCLVAFFLLRQNAKDKQKQQELSAQQQAAQAAQITKAAANESLATVRTCMYQLLQQIPPHLNLITPAIISEINSPTPIIERQGFFTFQFLVICSGEINPDMVKSVLQTRLNQMTQAGELPFAEKVYFHNGVMRNILQILTVTSNGSHAVFEVGIAGEALCHWLELQASVKGGQMQPLTRDSRDWDY